MGSLILICGKFDILGATNAAPTGGRSRNVRQRVEDDPNDPHSDDEVLHDVINVNGGVDEASAWTIGVDGQVQDNYIDGEEDGQNEVAAAPPAPPDPAPVNSRYIKIYDVCRGPAFAVPTDALPVSPLPQIPFENGRPQGDNRHQFHEFIDQNPEVILDNLLSELWNDVAHWTNASIDRLGLRRVTHTSAAELKALYDMNLFMNAWEHPRIENYFKGQTYGGMSLSNLSNIMSLHRYRELYQVMRYSDYSSVGPAQRAVNKGWKLLGLMRFNSMNEVQ
jgi:hypothetical protein